MPSNARQLSQSAKVGGNSLSDDQGVKLLWESLFGIGRIVELISVEAGIVVGKKLGHKVGVEFFLDLGVGFFVGDVVDLVRVFFKVVKLESRTWAEAEIPVVFVSWVFAVLKHPGAGGASIDIAVGYPGVFSDDLPAGWIVGI